MDQKILYHVDIVNSKSDVYGNRYWFMTVIRNSDGLTASGIFDGGESNGIYAMYELCNQDWNRFSYSRKEVGYREYKKLTKGMQYIGCRADQVILGLKFA